MLLGLPKAKKRAEMLLQPCSTLEFTGARVALRNSNPNTLLKRDSNLSVRITHPAHPLNGQTLTILPILAHGRSITLGTPHRAPATA